MALIGAGHNVLCAVTQPDRKKGRGLRFKDTAVKLAAKTKEIEVFQPDNVNSLQSREYLKKKEADLFVVVSYGKILSRQVLDIPKIFCINAHGSLLPKYRGAAPINWALIKGESETGVTIIKMNEEMDAGMMIMQEAISIEAKDNFISLENKLFHLAADLLVKAVARIENKKYELIPQDESKVSFAPKLKKEDGLIKWEKPAREIYNLIRGCVQWPSAFTYYKGKLLKIYGAEVIQLAGETVSGLAGEITDISKEGIAVRCGKDTLIIKELQLEGKRRMSAQEFISGHNINEGEKLGKD
ncbi:MAG: methionyl-tRNA formyltransferase [Candidatus Omnitrophica bacterium]|nr:methionyl-tRNA formyltransferase [Candidatus Omnitrophota bacterium]